MRSTLWTRLLAAALLVCALLAPPPCGAQETEGRHPYLLLGLDTYADDITDNARTDTMMLVTLDGISILVRLIQSLNAYSPMLVTPSGIV